MYIADNQVVFFMRQTSDMRMMKPMSAKFHSVEFKPCAEA